jgi:2-iminobutanoate/2-iminopropanoate deaminase
MNDQKKCAVHPGRDTSTGAYSPGIVIGQIVYVSGQGPLDPASGQIIGKTIEEQTELTLRNVQRILEAAGCTLDDCAKITVHLGNIADFNRFNATYQRFFNQPYPARTTVQSVLWGGILVEIDVVAVRGCAKARS